MKNKERFGKTNYTLDLGKLKTKPNKVIVNGVDYTTGFEFKDKNGNWKMKIRPPKFFK